VTIAVFESPGRHKSRTAVDLERVEAITEGDEGVVTLVTHGDVYRVIAEFDDVVGRWIESKGGEKHDDIS
jgi:hypothetical protein